MTACCFNVGHKILEKLLEELIISYILIRCKTTYGGRCCLDVVRLASSGLASIDLVSTVMNLQIWRPSLGHSYSLIILTGRSASTNIQKDAMGIYDIVGSNWAQKT